jgi:nitroreductase
MNDETGLFEIMYSMRAMRRLKPDPVPDALVRRILEAGMRAPNGGNAQRWAFLVVKDPAVKKQIQPFYRRAFDEVRASAHAASRVPPGMTGERHERQHSAVEYLTDHFHEAPVWIVPCTQDSKVAPVQRAQGASIYPAVQNMLLAARALGLGATLTTRHLFYEREVEAILGLPEGMRSYAILPIGWPMGKFGQVTRGKVEDFVYLDRWGARWEGL